MKPDWSKVYNVVNVRSSAQDVDFPPQTAAIGWIDHPAHPMRLGQPDRPNYRVYNFASPLLQNPAQALVAAETILARVSAAASTHEYRVIPDATRSASDTMLGATVTGGRQISQLASVGHPLTVGELQPVTTVSTQLEVEE